MKSYWIIRIPDDQLSTRRSTSGVECRRSYLRHDYEVGFTALKESWLTIKQLKVHARHCQTQAERRHSFGSDPAMIFDEPMMPLGLESRASYRNFLQCWLIPATVVTITRDMIGSLPSLSRY